MRCHELERVTAKVAESEERLAGMRTLLRKGLGFNNLEDYLDTNSKMGKVNRVQGREEKQVINIMMKRKINDEKRNLRNLKSQEKLLRMELRNPKGKKNKNQRKYIKELNIMKNQTREKYRKKYLKKIHFLEKKHASKIIERNTKRNSNIDKYKEEYPNLNIYDKNETE